MLSNRDIKCLSVRTQRILPVFPNKIKKPLNTIQPYLNILHIFQTILSILKLHKSKEDNTKSCHFLSNKVPLFGKRANS